MKSDYLASSMNYLDADNHPLLCFFSIKLYFENTNPSALPETMAFKMTIIHYEKSQLGFYSVCNTRFAKSLGIIPPNAALPLSVENENTFSVEMNIAISSSNENTNIIVSPEQKQMLEELVKNEFGMQFIIRTKDYQGIYEECAISSLVQYSSDTEKHVVLTQKKGDFDYYKEDREYANSLFNSAPRSLNITDM